MSIANKRMSITFFLLFGLEIITNAAKDEPNEIDYWRYEQDEKLIQVELEENNYQPFPTSCFLIIQKIMGAKPKYWNIFYYVPRNATQEEIIGMAALAAGTDYHLHPKNRVRRELEGFESDSFMELVPIFEKFKFYEQRSSSRQTEVIDWNVEKLFIFEREKGRNILTQVQMDLKYVLTKYDHCLVYDALEEVYVYCDEQASEEQKRGAQELAKILLERRQKKSGVVIVASPRKFKVYKEIGFHEFIEFFPSRPSKIGTSFAEIRVIDDFEHHAGFTLKEIRRIFCHSEIAPIDKQESFNLDIIDVNSINYEKVNLFRNSSYLSKLEHFRNTNCYVIDTQSNLGLLVWIGRNAKVDSRRKAARMAEKRLTVHAYGTPVTFIDEEDITKELLGVSELNRTTINYLVTKVLK